MAKRNTAQITVPKHLSRVAQNFYRSTVKELETNGLFQNIDKGAIEMLATLYGTYRDPLSSEKDRREAIKLFVSMMKEYGGTPASRQKLRLEMERDDEDPEQDLKDFLAE